MMDEPVYSEWRSVIKPGNQKELYGCCTCQSSIAALERRYVTDRNGERYEQFRVHCPLCDTCGKVYRNRNVAIQSWIGKEHILQKPLNPYPKRG